MLVFLAAVHSDALCNWPVLPFFLLKMVVCPAHHLAYCYPQPREYGLLLTSHANRGLVCVCTADDQIFVVKVRNVDDFSLSTYMVLTSISVTEKYPNKIENR